MVVRGLKGGAWVVLGVALGVGSMVAAMRLQKPADPGFDLGVEKDVAVKTLPPGDSAARYEATLVAKAKGTYSEYMGMLMARASRDCAGGSYSIDEGTYGPDVDSPVPAGEKLRIVVSCHHNRLPNHQVVAADDLTLLETGAPAGLQAKSGSMLLTAHRGDKRLAIEAMLGGYLREIYTEQCEGKAVLVQYIGTASSPGQPHPDIPNPENVQATLHYQCVDAAAVAGP